MMIIIRQSTIELLYFHEIIQDAWTRNLNRLT